MAEFPHQVQGAASWAARPRLPEAMRGHIRPPGLSIRTEEAHGGRMRRFILADDRRQPRDMGVPEVEAFLTALATDGQVAASTTNGVGF